MDNAKAIESILEEGPDAGRGGRPAGRRATFQSYEASIWDRLMDCDPTAIAQLLAEEHPQTIAYVLSMMPSSFGAKVLLQLSDKQRPDVLNRAVNIKNVSPKASRHHRGARDRDDRGDGGRTQFRPDRPRSPK